MLRKGLAVAVILLFIGVAFIPSINAKGIEINDDIIEPLDIGRTILRGWGLFPHHCGDNFIFFALSVHYITITGTSRTTGTIRFRWITSPSPIGFNWAGPLGMFGYMFGSTFRGGIDW